MDYEDVDKEMSLEMHKIYSDPQKHAFYSNYQAFKDMDIRGSRGGKITGRKRTCAYCGTGPRVHIQKEF